MNLIKANQNGRSIMEMLGVLAVVGILSVGGIAGFSTAMSKHKNMKEVENIICLFRILCSISR